jgi:excisionase family DNA binding protein
LNADEAPDAVQNSADLWRGPDDELLDSREAAMLLTVKRSTLLSWAREGRVPVVRLGPRHLRWTRPLLREIRDSALDPGRRF